VQVAAIIVWVRKKKELFNYLASKHRIPAIIAIKIKNLVWLRSTAIFSILYISTLCIKYVREQNLN